MRPDLPAGPLRELNALLHRLRDRSGLSSRQIAEAIRRRYGIAPSHTTIHQLFTRPKLPPADLVLKVAEALVNSPPGGGDDRVLDEVDRLWQLAADHRQSPSPPAPQQPAGQLHLSRHQDTMSLRWTVLCPTPSTPTCVLRAVTAADATSAWAVGIDNYQPSRPEQRGVPVIYRRDGIHWSRVPLPDLSWDGGLNLVAADSPTNAFAIGNSSGPEPADNATRVLHYNGTDWHEVPFPLDNPDNYQQINGLAVIGGHAWLVGQDRNTPLILECDGQSWIHHQPPPECHAQFFGGTPAYGNLLAVTAFTPNDIWACGNGAWPGFSGPLLFHWDGLTWTTIPLTLNQEDIALHHITGTSANDLWAIGNTVLAPAPRSLAIHGNTETWRTYCDLPPVKLNGITQDAAGRPWIIQNDTSTVALAHHNPTTDTWTHHLLQHPPGTTGLTIYGITAMPHNPTILAVGAAHLPTNPLTLQAIIIENQPP